MIISPIGHGGNVISSVPGLLREGRALPSQSVPNRMIFSQRFIPFAVWGLGVVWTGWSGGVAETLGEKAGWETIEAEEPGKYRRR